MRQNQGSFLIAATADRPVTPPAGSAGGIARAGRELTNLQVLRGLAAGLVLLHHIAAYGQFLRGAARPFPILDDRMGLWGVALFFALSGTLMAGLVRRDPPLVFLAHRVSRIFPPYLAVVALAAAVFAALRLDFGSLSPLTLSLAPAGPRAYPLNVEWTLVFEVSFYVGLFLLATVGRVRLLVPLALVWLGVLAATCLLAPGLSAVMVPTAYEVPLAAASVAFAAGLLLPRAIEAGLIRPWFALLALPLGVASLYGDDGVARALSGLAAALVVGSAVVAPPIRREGPVGRPLTALGDWSYMLYLAHPPVLFLAHWACPPHWPDAAFAALGLTGSLAAAAILGPLDVAAYRRLRARLGTLGPTGLRRLATVFLVIFTGCAAWGSVDAARNQWAEHRARTALAALTAEEWATPARAKAALDAKGLALPASVHGRIEEATRHPSGDALIRAVAFDPAKPDRAFHLALYCQGRLLSVDRPRRMRRDLIGQPGYEGLGSRRIGFRLRLPTEPCAPDGVMAVAVDGGGRMAVLDGLTGPE